MQVYSVEGLPGCGKTTFCRLLRDELLNNEYRDYILVVEELSPLEVFRLLSNEAVGLMDVSLSYAMESLDTRGYYYVMMKMITSMLSLRCALMEYRSLHGGEDPRVIVMENFHGYFERNVLLSYMQDEFGMTNNEIDMFRLMLNIMLRYFGVQNLIGAVYTIYIECPMRVITQHRTLDRVLDGRLPRTDLMDELHTYIGLIEAEANITCRNTVAESATPLQLGVMSLVNNGEFISHFH